MSEKFVVMGEHEALLGLTDMKSFWIIVDQRRYSGCVYWLDGQYEAVLTVDEEGRTHFYSGGVRYEHASFYALRDLAIMGRMLYGRVCFADNETAVLLVLSALLRA